jgi:hypothetical protein
MDEGAIELVYRHARGLGEGMIKASTAVNELLIVADRDDEVLRAALEKARRDAGEETADATGEDSPDDSDAPGPQAPALLAVRLIEQALDELKAR